MGTKTKNRKPVAEVAKGILLAVIFTVISAAVYAILIQNQTVSEAGLGIWRSVTLGAAAMIGCLLAAGRIGEKRLVYSLITGGVFAFVLLAVGIVFLDGTITNIVGNVVAILIGSGISCLKAMKKPSKKLKFKIRSR